MADPDRARTEMVDVLRDGGRVRSPAVEDAMRDVPRHLFLPGLSVAAAYADEAVAVQFEAGVATSSASQPSMVAIMLEQLDLRPGHRVLEIGAGTGYNAALISRIVGPAGHVTSIDIDEDLVDRAAGHLAAAGVDRVELVAADGALGHPPGAPYDRIVLTVGSDDVWPAWVAQLAPGGRLLLPLAVHGSQLSIALDLGPDGVLCSDSVRSCAFIRLRGEGASQDVLLRLPGLGLAVQVPDDAPAPAAAALRAALAEPGEPVGSAVPLCAVDMWDGFGLWLALTEPGACRLLPVRTDDGLPAGLGPLGSAGGTLGLIAGDSDPVPGLAAVASTDPARAERGPGPVVVRPYGPAGPALAARLLAALERWAAAERPEAVDWRFTVVPHGAQAPEQAPGTAYVVRKRHSTLTVAAPTDPTPAASAPAAEGPPGP